MSMRRSAKSQDASSKNAPIADEFGVKPPLRPVPERTRFLPRRGCVISPVLARQRLRWEDVCKDKATLKEFRWNVARIFQKSQDWSSSFEHFDKEYQFERS